MSLRSRGLVGLSLRSRGLVGLSRGSRGLGRLVGLSRGSRGLGRLVGLSSGSLGLVGWSRGLGRGLGSGSLRPGVGGRRLAGSGNLGPGVGGRALGSLVLGSLVVGRTAMDLMPELVGVNSQHEVLDKAIRLGELISVAIVQGNEDVVLSFDECCELGLVKTIALVHSNDGELILVAGALGLVLRSTDQVHLPDVFSVRLSYSIGVSALEDPLERDTSAHDFLRLGLGGVGGWLRHDSGLAWHATVVDHSEHTHVDGGIRVENIKELIRHGDGDAVRADHSWVKGGSVNTIGRVNGQGGV